jgi:hypothetical protein
MIIYNVTVNIDNDVAGEWLQWMKDVHIPEVLQTGMFVENHIYRLVADENSGGVSYAIQYVCESMERYELYRDTHAKRLQEEHSKRYKDKFVAFRTLLEVIQ